MDKELMNEVLKRLDMIGEKLGYGANYFWPKFIRQEYIDGWVSVVLLLVFAALFVGVLYYTVRHWKPKNEDGTTPIYSIYGNNHEGFWIFITTILFIILSYTGVNFLSKFFDIFNPEYWALKSLIETFKH